MDLDVYDVACLVDVARAHRVNTVEQGEQRKRWIAALKRCVDEKIAAEAGEPGRPRK